MMQVINELGVPGQHKTRKFRIYTYNEDVEKGLLIIYSLLTGNSNQEMLISGSSFQILNKKLFTKQIDKLNTWLDTQFEKLFNTENIRVLSAKINNPRDFKSVTMYLDGHDSRINYSSLLSIDKVRSGLYSFKLKKSGCRTQIMMDINGMFLNFSDSEACGLNNDGSMFKRMRVDQLINVHDVVQMDGGFTLFVDQLVEMNREEGGQITANNFLCPIRKERGKNLAIGEEEYNEKFGAKLSKIETGFAHLGNTFHKFNWKHVHKIQSFENFNIQLKLACFFLNVRKCEQFLKLQVEPHHSFWGVKNFDFEKVDSSLAIVTPKVAIQLQKIEEMSQLQNEFIEQLAQDDAGFA